MYEKGIETFIAVAMSRTLGKAAELLNVTQSTISYNLSVLEQELGMSLVDRSRGMKSVTLTSFGESFLPLALKWQDVSREIMSVRDSVSSCFLSIGGSETVNCRLLPNVYRNMMAHKPPVFLKIETYTSDMMYEEVGNRKLDIAITLHKEYSRYVNIDPFYSEALIVARIPYEGQDMENVISPLALPPENECYIEWCVDYRLWHDRVWNSSKTPHKWLDSVVLAAALMERGDWCIVPNSAKNFLKGTVPCIVFQQLTEPPTPIYYYKLTHKNPKPSAKYGVKIFDEVAKANGFTMLGVS